MDEWMEPTDAGWRPMWSRAAEALGTTIDGMDAEGWQYMGPATKGAPGDCFRLRAGFGRAVNGKNEYIIVPRRAPLLA